MKFLIVYGTTEGQTRKIVQAIVKQLENRGHEAKAFDSDRRMADLEITTFDAAILAGSVHEQRHQETFTNFVIAHRQQLRELPTLLISVSLSIAFKDGRSEAQRYVDNFQAYTEFNPKRVSLVAGALRYKEYDYFMSQIIEHVVLGDREQIREDREFTDWTALESDVDAFVDLVAGTA